MVKSEFLPLERMVLDVIGNPPLEMICTAVVDRRRPAVTRS